MLFPRFCPILLGQRSELKFSHRAEQAEMPEGLPQVLHRRVDMLVKWEISRYSHWCCRVKSSVFTVRVLFDRVKHRDSLLVSKPSKEFGNSVGRLKVRFN